MLIGNIFQFHKGTIRTLVSEKFMPDFQKISIP